MIFRALGVTTAILAMWIATANTAEAIATYDAQMNAFLDLSQGVPAGTSLTFLNNSSIASPPLILGNATASSQTAFTQNPFGVSAMASGTAGPPPGSRAQSGGTSIINLTLANSNASAVAYGFNLGVSGSASSSEGPNESASAVAAYQLALDLFGLADPKGSGGIDAGGNQSLAFPSVIPVSFTLDPGSHTLQLLVQVAGIAVSDQDVAPNTVPELATLFLLGSSFAGVGLAGWKRRKS